MRAAMNSSRPLVKRLGTHGDGCPIGKEKSECPIARICRPTTHLQPSAKLWQLAFLLLMRLNRINVLSHERQMELDNWAM